MFLIYVNYSNVVSNIVFRPQRREPDESRIRRFSDCLDTGLPFQIRL